MSFQKITPVKKARKTAAPAPKTTNKKKAAAKRPAAKRPVGNKG
ncbi:hypothetical protein ACIBBD_27395 [Streptomyces sp. NPDC051315]